MERRGDEKKSVEESWGLGKGNKRNGIGGRPAPNEISWNGILTKDKGQGTNSDRGVKMRLILLS